MEDFLIPILATKWLSVLETLAIGTVGSWCSCHGQRASSGDEAMRWRRRGGIGRGYKANKMGIELVWNTTDIRLDRYRSMFLSSRVAVSFWGFSSTHHQSPIRVWFWCELFLLPLWFLTSWRDFGFSW
jgi:hypothetical protein